MKSFARSQSVLLVLSFALGLGHALAQAKPTGSHLGEDLAGGVTVIHANEGPGQCGCFYMVGGNGEFTLIGQGHFAFVTNVGYTSASNVANIGRNLALLTVLEGGRYIVRPQKKVSPFAQVSVGLVHTTSTYTVDQNAFRAAFAAGGGVDLRLSRRFSIRPVEAEYLSTNVPNGQNNFQNQLRLSAGLVFHLR